jgi:hypothetical protein
MALARRLADLYVVGKEVVLDDGEGPVTVYVRKLSPADHDRAVKAAHAARSRLLAARADPDSDEFAELISTARELPRESLLTYLGEDERIRRRSVVEAELAAEDEWSKDSYLTGLQEAWETSGERTLREEPDDPDAKRIAAELGRFRERVDAVVDEHVTDYLDSVADRSDQALQELVLDKTVESRAAVEWITEFRRCEIWLAVREPDKRTRVFNGRTEIDELSQEVLEQLTSA